MRVDGPIVVGVESEWPDRVVLGWAAAEAAARGAELRVCHVRERVTAGEPVSVEADAGAVVAGAGQLARTWFPGLRVSAVLGHGPVVPALIGASMDARMLVVGRHAGAGIAARVGSVADRISARAWCPVAVVRPERPSDPVDVVVGVEGRAHSDTALRAAAAEARRFGGTLIVVHAYQLPLPAERGPNAGVDEPRHRVAAEELLERAVAGLGAGSADFKLETRAVHGRPAEVLVAASASAAVTVVGAGRTHRLGVPVLPPVSRQVLHEAASTVLVAR